jgi:DNA ligase-1
MDATAADEEEISRFYKNAVDVKCEGIMVKVLDNVDEPVELPGTQSVGDKSKATRRKQLLATYEPDKRLESWCASFLTLLENAYHCRLKVKKDYDSNADSLDLVPIGAWHGMNNDRLTPILRCYCRTR